MVCHSRRKLSRRLHVVHHLGLTWALTSTRCLFRRCRTWHCKCLRCRQLGARGLVLMLFDHSGPSTNLLFVCAVRCGVSGGV
jgi:hypothetical protein